MYEIMRPLLEEPTMAVYCQLPFVYEQSQMFLNQFSINPGTLFEVLPSLYMS
jgi:hypothetical protein